MMMHDRKKAVTVILSKIKDGKVSGDTHVKPEVELDDEKSSIKALAEEVLMAISHQSAADLADALQAFFKECELEPHEEGPHESED